MFVRHFSQTMLYVSVSNGKCAQQRSNGAASDQPDTMIKKVHTPAWSSAAIRSRKWLPTRGGQTCRRRSVAQSTTGSRPAGYSTSPRQTTCEQRDKIACRKYTKSEVKKCSCATLVEEQNLSNMRPPLLDWLPGHRSSVLRFTGVFNVHVLGSWYPRAHDLNRFQCSKSEMRSF